MSDLATMYTLACPADQDGLIEVLVDGEWVPLVRSVHPDACDYCRRGIWVGFDHPECATMTPSSNRY